jgi:hypothetical protein
MFTKILHCMSTAVSRCLPEKTSKIGRREVAGMCSYLVRHGEVVLVCQELQDGLLVLETNIG